MKTEPFQNLISLLQRLDNARIPYHLRHSRPDAVMIVAFAPGQYWEIEILADGEVAIERFRSGGEIEPDAILAELFEIWADAGSKPENVEDRDVA